MPDSVTCSPGRKEYLGWVRYISREERASMRGKLYLPQGTSIWGSKVYLPRGTASESVAEYEVNLKYSR